MCTIPAVKRPSNETMIRIRDECYPTLDREYVSLNTYRNGYHMTVAQYIISITPRVLKRDILYNGKTREEIANEGSREDFCEFESMRNMYGRQYVVAKNIRECVKKRAIIALLPLPIAEEINYAISIDLI